MNNVKKFLPIGTICKYGNEDVMIIGYFNDNNFEVQRKYEYIVCNYPEGVTGNNYKFINHYEIEGLVQIGYKNDKYDTLNDILYKLKNKTNYIFDANGVVIKETEIEEPIENPFIQPQESSKSEEESLSSNEWPIFSNIVFDENGFVVSAEENVYNEKNSNDNKLKFDENGFVIEDSVESPTQKKESNIRFDENGFVIEDGVEEAPTKKESNIKFDENGFVIEDDVAEVPAKKESNIKFDENGFVIAD